MQAPPEFRRWHRPAGDGVCTGPGWAASCACDGQWYVYSCGHGTNECPWPFRRKRAGRPVPCRTGTWTCRECGEGTITTVALQAA
jgi:hypothetical protein